MILDKETDSEIFPSYLYSIFQSSCSSTQVAMRGFVEEKICPLNFFRTFFSSPDQFGSRVPEVCGKTGESEGKDRQTSCRPYKDVLIHCFAILVGTLFFCFGSIFLSRSYFDDKRNFLGATLVGLGVLICLFGFLYGFLMLA